MYLSVSKIFLAVLVVSAAAMNLLTTTSQSFAAKGIDISLIEDGLDKAMRLRAGKDAIDCGRIRIGDDSDKSDKCVAKAHEEKRPFIARYDLRGIDSIVSVGLVGNDGGEIYVFRYDSDPSGGSNIGESIRKQKCRGIRITKNKRGRQIKCEK